MHLRVLKESYYFTVFHRAFAAALAIADRFRGLSLLARALPPLLAPSFESA